MTDIFLFNDIPHGSSSLKQRMPPKKRRAQLAQAPQMGQNLDSEQVMSDSDSASSVDPDMVGIVSHSTLRTVHLLAINV